MLYLSIIVPIEDFNKRPSSQIFLLTDFAIASRSGQYLTRVKVLVGEDSIFCEWCLDYFDYIWKDSKPFDMKKVKVVEY